MSANKTAGQILKEARLKKDLTQAEVADKAGIHPNTYAKIERGENKPSSDSVKKLIKVLNIESSQIPHLL
jgi:transcriptional regulator with XRE-family HTH domain